MLLQLQFLLLILIPLLSLLLFFFFNSNSKIPKSYPLVGSFFALLANRDRLLPWLTGIIQDSPSNTFVLRQFFATGHVISGNPAVVQHILMTNFNNYGKGEDSHRTVYDLLGQGIFNVDGESWKFQRQIAMQEFNTKSLRKFVETVVHTEVSQRLIPTLTSAAEHGTVLDFQDILQRFTFDNICNIAFGFDPAYLLPSLPQTKLDLAFENGIKCSSERGNTLFPGVWKIKKLLNIGSEKRLKIAISEIRGFAMTIIKEKKQELREKESLDSVDLLSRLLNSGHLDENFVIDFVISFMLAGRDTSSAALTWFFWVLSKNPEIESEILKEIKEKSEGPVYDEVKDMVYTHASLCESMRLYPPVALDAKEAVNDDVLPDGTVFKPERWLQKEEEKSNSKSSWRFVGRDSYTYPVFQAGPRICLGKEMAFLQMKSVVAGVLRRFKVVPAFEQGVQEPEYDSFLSKMKGGFPVKIADREGSSSF
nr:cytochrome p450 94a1 [Quercus suber]